MLTIYGVYRSRASRNIWLANELGIAFRHVPVIQNYRLKGEVPPGTLHTKSPEFLAVNPNGHIPSIDDDGFVLHESLAINLYLARKHGGPLAPADVREEGLAAMWSLWAATEAEPQTLQILYHMAARPPEERDPAIAAAALAAIEAPMAVLERHLGENSYMMGGRFTVVDINVAEVMRCSLPAKSLWERAPHVSAWLKTCHARPAFQAMVSGRNAEPE